MCVVCNYFNLSISLSIDQPYEGGVAGDNEGDEVARVITHTHKVVT